MTSRAISIGCFSEVASARKKDGGFEISARGYTLLQGSRLSYLPLPGRKMAAA